MLVVNPDIIDLAHRQQRGCGLCRRAIATLGRTSNGISLPESGQIAAHPSSWGKLTSTVIQMKWFVVFCHHAFIHDQNLVIIHDCVH